MPPRSECRIKVNTKQFTSTFNVVNKIKISSPSKTKLTFTIKTISNKRRIARTVVWTLGISARCIRMAFVHLKGMGLAALVDVWERTYTVKKKLLITLNYTVILSHQRSITVSLETYPYIHRSLYQCTVEITHAGSCENTKKFCNSELEAIDFTTLVNR